MLRARGITKTQIHSCYVLQNLSARKLKMTVSSSTSHEMDFFFYLKVTLRFPRGSLENLKRFVSPCKREMLIRFIWCVKLHGKNYQISDDKLYVDACH